MFKNVIFYNLSDFNLDDAALTDALQRNPFEPCGKFDLKSEGWVAPAGGDTEFVRTINGATLISLCVEKKSIPSSIIKMRLAEKVEDHEARHGEKPSKKDQRAMKDDIVFELTPLAFPKQDVIRVIISADRKWIALDTSSAKKAEDVLAFLRNDLGSMKATPVTPETPVEPVLTQWLTTQELPEKISLPGDCSLNDHDGGVVTCKNLDLFSEEVQNHLGSGKTVTKMAVNFDERMTFTLDATLILKSVKFDGSLTPEVDESEDDEEAQLCYLTDGWLASLAPEFNAAFNFLNEQFI